MNLVSVLYDEWLIEGDGTNVQRGQGAYSYFPIWPEAYLMDCG